MKIIYVNINVHANMAKPIQLLKNDNIKQYAFLHRRQKLHDTLI